jgi:hypothetical protein
LASYKPGNKYHIKEDECMGEEKINTHCWSGLKGKRPLGRPRCRWEKNIKMHFKEVGCVLVLTMVIMRIIVICDVM